MNRKQEFLGTRYKEVDVGLTAAMNERELQKLRVENEKLKADLAVLTDTLDSERDRHHDEIKRLLGEVVAEAKARYHAAAAAVKTRCYSPAAVARIVHENDIVIRCDHGED